MPIIKCPDCHKEISDAAPVCPGCGRPNAREARSDKSLNAYVSVHSKSQFVGFFLTLIFGPLGLFYSSWVAALILCAIAVISAVTIIIPILCWPIAIVLSLFTVSSHNDKVQATANMASRK